MLGAWRYGLSHFRILGWGGDSIGVVRWGRLVAIKFIELPISRDTSKILIRPDLNDQIRQHGGVLDTAARHLEGHAFKFFRQFRYVSYAISDVWSLHGYERSTHLRPQI